MNITVYLGSAAGHDPVYRKRAEELGTWIGKSGHGLVYGGSRVGLMGVLAEAVLRAGGHVTGVEPQFFIDAGLEQLDLTQLIVVQTMPERKTRMIELGDAYIAFPGGTGTLEEISEIMSLVRLGHTEKPCILYNLNGFYEPLRQMLGKMTEEGFLPEKKRQKIRFAGSLPEIADILAES